MLTVVSGLILGFAVNRWWAVVLPIAFGLILGSAINAVSILTVSIAGVIAVAIGIFIRRRFETRRARPDARR